MFVGTHTVGVDARGRFSIPAAFRAELPTPVVYVWPSWRGPFLEAGDQALLERLHAALAQRGEFDDVREDFEYAIFADAAALTLDETGRAALPEELRAHAGIQGKAAFAGMKDRFEIWRPEDLEARKAAGRSKASANRPALSRAAAE